MYSPLGHDGGAGRARLLWLIGLIALVFFAFFAFCFSAASLAKVNKVEAGAGTTNNWITPAAGISVNYKVAKNHKVSKGHVVSYVDNEGEIGRGLGPEFDAPAFIHASGWASSSARVAEISTFNAQASVYVFAPHDAPSILSILTVTTPAAGNATITHGLNYTVPDGNITFVHVRTLDATHFAVLYSTYSDQSGHEIWIATGMTSPDYSSFSINQAKSLNNIAYQWNVTIDMVVLKDETNPQNAVLMIAYGMQWSACQQLWYYLDPSNFFYIVPFTPSSSLSLQCDPPVKTHYLNNGLFAVANSDTIVLGQINWGTRVMSQIASSNYGHHAYETLSLTAVPDRSILVLSGVQRDMTPQGNMIITQVVEYSSGLRVHGAVPLLPTDQFQAYHDHIRACYIAPDTWHPYGVLLFTYVDQHGYPSILRGKINHYQDYWWILSSPRITVSHIPYVGRPRDPSAGPNERVPEPYGPLLVCPNTKALIVLQNYWASMNTFWWSGGYRVAGIADGDANQGQTVKVGRAGAINNLEYLETGFGYYANNSGSLHPTTSTSELYARSGWDERIGMSISPKELAIDFDVFERINSRE